MSYSGSAKIRDKVTKRLETTICRDIAGSVQEPVWPHAFPLGTPTQQELKDVARMAEKARDTFGFCHAYHLEVETANHGRGYASASYPSHVIVESRQKACQIAGGKWPALAAVLEQRRNVMQDVLGISAADTIAEVLSKTKSWSDTDFGLLVDASYWFKTHDVSGRQVRSVPIPGFSGKWLEQAGHERLICLMIGKDALGLAERARSFTYRLLDGASVERRMMQGMNEYGTWVLDQPDLYPRGIEEAWIVENLATFRSFPEVGNGLVIYGSGWEGTSSIPLAGWLKEVPRVYYWGDLDADGIQILSKYRSNGLACTSVLMGYSAYLQWKRFGTSIPTGKRSLESREEAKNLMLDDDEQKLYTLLCDDLFSGYRRIEQEKIPYRYALEAAHGKERTAESHAWQ